jgi:Ca2+-binding EF-hand superfamily protein
MAEVDAGLGASPNGEVDAKDRLRLADVDNNGVLSDAEVRKGTISRFHLIDVNTDGNIDRDEFSASFGVPSDTP